MPLSDTACRLARAQERPYKMSDGEGLHMLVTTTGARLWRMQYRFDGKQKTLALGQYPSVGLPAARSKRLAAKKHLAAGIDPATVKKQGDAAGDGMDFESIAREWFEKNCSRWVLGHRARVLARLEDDVFPILGSRSIDSITPPEILELLRKIEARGAIEMAKRVRQTISAVFRYAIALGKAQVDPAQNIRDALRVAPRVKHHAAVKAKDLPDFFEKLFAYDGEEQTRLAIELTMHTFVRTGEIVGALRTEFEYLHDADKATWRIPAERMKLRREHIVPLTPAAVALVHRLLEIAGDSPYLLPGKMGGTISNNTMLFALYRAGFHSRVTIHGMRTLASTTLNEAGFNRDWIERQLAHVPGDDVRAAYNAAEWLAERRQMMIWYSDFLEQKAMVARLLS